MSGDSLDEIVKPKMKQAYEADKKNWLARDKFSQRTPDLFKSEFVGRRNVWLSAKSYLVQNQNKFGKNNSCKGVSNKHNDLYFEHQKDVLDVFQKTRIDSELEGRERMQALESLIKAL